jgi:hypothetical protein
MFSKAASALGTRREAQEEGESLTTILRSLDDRNAFTLLVADCTEAMRQAIEDTFDANETGAVPDIQSAAPQDAGKSEQLENEPVATQPPDEAAERARLEKQQKELAQREKELSQAKMQELKAAALEHWDQWRSNVIQRIGEVMNSVDEEERRQNQAAAQKVPEKRTVSPSADSEATPKYDQEVNASMRKLYPPIENPLRALPEEQRTLIMHSLLLLLLSLEHYHADSRVLLLRVSTSLDLPIDVLGLDESKVARGLLAAAENMSADEETKKKAEDNKAGRRWKVGLATVAGAALIGITGGLAAPRKYIIHVPIFLTHHLRLTRSSFGGRPRHGDGRYWPCRYCHCWLPRRPR